MSDVSSPPLFLGPVFEGKLVADSLLVPKVGSGGEL